MRSKQIGAREGHTGEMLAVTDDYCSLLSPCTGPVLMLREIRSPHPLAAASTVQQPDIQNTPLGSSWAPTPGLARPTDRTHPAEHWET